MTDEELRVLAWTLLGEAGGEGARGMEAVAHVIRNRAASGRFPNNPAAVATQKNSSGVHQFSTWNPLGNGGNLPRSQYPVGSASFTKALTLVEKVFGDRPGADPTQGATHYYSPKGMAGGAAPYWWRSEAKRGEKSIGGHIFAVKYSPKEAPVPARRANATAAPGVFPTATELEVLRTGKPARLPELAPPNPISPEPKTQSNRLRLTRQPASTIRDPITQRDVPARVSASDLAQAAGSAKVAQGSSVAAPRTQSVAGFSGSGASPPPLNPAPRPTARPNTQTTFAPALGQPAGSLTETKDAARLAPGSLAQDAAPQSGGLSRDAVAQRIAGREAVTQRALPTRVAPVPVDVAMRPPVPIAPPRPALEIVVNGAGAERVGQTIRESAPTKIKGHTVSGNMVFDPDSSSWNRVGKSNTASGSSKGSKK
jgi:hypothetical protein